MDAVHVPGGLRQFYRPTTNRRQPLLLGVDVVCFGLYTEKVHSGQADGSRREPPPFRSVGLLKMPVTPLPAFNTKRYRVTYNNGLDDHNIQFRCADTFTDADARDFIDAIFTAAAPFLFVVTINAFDRLDHGSDVGIPLSLVGFDASYGSGVINAVQSPFGLTFSGRGALGRKVNFKFIGVKLQGDANYVYTAAENAAVLAVVNILNTGSTQFFLSIDGQAATWYPRATAKQNDHFIRRRRSA